MAAVLQLAETLSTLGDSYSASKQNEKAQDAYYQVDIFYDVAGVAWEDRLPKARMKSLLEIRGWCIFNST